MRPVHNSHLSLRAIVSTTAAVLFALPATANIAAAQSYPIIERAGPLLSSPVADVVDLSALLGERAVYDVELKGHGVGTASIEVLGREMVDGHETLHATMKVAGGLLFAKVNDRIDSWFDPLRFYSRRFTQDQHEVGSTRKKNYEISPERGISQEMNSGEIDSLSTKEPLDDVSMLFYIRTLPLHVGSIDTIPRYFKRGRDVIIHVVRREKIRVPAGTFETIVVKPTITNVGGLFGQGGKAEVYVTDDSLRTVVMVRSSIPVIGSLSLTLRQLTRAK